MCGIAGFFRFSGPDTSDGKRLERMAACLEHRGPDDFGYLLANREQGRARAGPETGADFMPDVLIASRRLSILDPSPAGRQPMANEDGTVFVVFDGAIHNYSELRAELKTLGHVFRSHTDTEVIVHAYEEWEEHCAKRFNGMWAYAIWDAPRRQLVCSRDRFGIKPLFAAWQGHTFYFASEIKAILAAGEVAAVANLPFLCKVLLDNVPSYDDNQTAFTGITRLPAAQNLVISRDSRRESVYWSYGDRSESYDYGHPEQTFRELFSDAVGLRLQSDVPVALLLSGGLDSSSITAFARRQKSGGKLTAFNATFPGFKGDERRHAERVAAHTGTHLKLVEYDHSRFLDDLAAVTWHMDTPPVSGQHCARWQLLEAASGEARVVFEGQGGDELLGGYPYCYLKPYIRSEISRLRQGNLHRRLPRIIEASLTHMLLRQRSWLSTLAVRLPHKKRMYSRGILSRELEALVEESAGQNPLLDTPFPDQLTAALLYDHAANGLPYLLHFGDAISMGHSVELRLPFLDHRLVEFVFGLPFDEKIRGSETKYILRRSLAADLPREIINRREKVGFYTPLRDWLKHQFHDGIRPLLTSRRVRERGIFDPEGLTNALDAFEKEEKRAERIFRCLAVERWFELFIDGEGFR